MKIKDDLIAEADFQRNRFDSARAWPAADPGARMISLLMDRFNPRARSHFEGHFPDILDR